MDAGSRGGSSDPANSSLSKDTSERKERRREEREVVAGHLVECHRGGQGEGCPGELLQRLRSRGSREREREHWGTTQWKIVPIRFELPNLSLVQAFVSLRGKVTCDQVHILIAK